MAAVVAKPGFPKQQRETVTDVSHDRFGKSGATRVPAGVFGLFGSSEFQPGLSARLGHGNALLNQMFGPTFDMETQFGIHFAFRCVCDALSRPAMSESGLRASQFSRRRAQYVRHRAGHLTPSLFFGPQLALAGGCEAVGPCLAVVFGFAPLAGDPALMSQGRARDKGIPAGSGAFLLRFAGCAAECHNRAAGPGRWP